MARAATARLFVALELPEEVCDELIGWARQAIADWRSWSARAPRVLGRDALHLTLCFLGSRPLAEIDALAAVLARLDAALQPLRCGTPVWLPPRRPRALAVQVRDDDGGLARLHAHASRELASASGWQPERRRYRPHITLVRLRQAPRGAGAGALPATPALSFNPRAIVLYRSRPTPAGSEYEPLAWSELG